MSAGDLSRTAIGRALLWRAAAIGIVAVALAVAHRARPGERSRVRFGAILVVAIAALAAIAVHVIAGHAAAVPQRPALAIAIQWLHFSAAAIWVGGLAALVLAIRGETAPAKAAAVRRFSAVAAAALIIVTVTGTVRALQEIATWKQAIATSYGQTVLVKALLLSIIAAFGALNRWHSVPAAATNLRR